MSIQYCKQYNTELGRNHASLHGSSPYKINIVSIYQVLSENKVNMVHYAIKK